MIEKKDSKMKADIVIIGAGGAGLPSALTAYEKGSHALVLRKRGIVGGPMLKNSSLKMLDKSESICLYKASARSKMSRLKLISKKLNT